MTETVIVRIKKAIALLRQLVKLELQHHWYYLPETEIDRNLGQLNLDNCQPALLNQRGYIIFPQGRQVRWLGQKLSFPRPYKGTRYRA